MLETIVVAVVLLVWKLGELLWAALKPGPLAKKLEKALERKLDEL